MTQQTADRKAAAFVSRTLCNEYVYVLKKERKKEKYTFFLTAAILFSMRTDNIIY